MKKVYLDATTTEVVIVDGEKEDRHPKGALRRSIAAGRFQLYNLVGDLILEETATNLADIAGTAYADMPALIAATDGAFS